MKRQWKETSDLFIKVPKTETESGPDARDDILKRVLASISAETREDGFDHINQPSSSSDMEDPDHINVNSELPDCWNTKQADEFKEKYEGLLVIGKKLGCAICAQVESVNMKSVHVSKEWKSCAVIACGTSKHIQQASLRKKMSAHFSSKAHQICEMQVKESTKNDVFKSIDIMNSTCKMFNTVYSLAKGNLSFSDIEQLVELQIKNGLEMVPGLHSQQFAMKIVDHIAKNIKKEVFSKIIEQNSKICVIIDEASTISCKPVLIIFIKVEDSHFSPTIFVDLVELQGQDAETIYTALLQSLHSVGFNIQYLKSNLVGFCSDGASVMLGKKSGVSVCVKKDFPEIVIWHCLSHRLQLILDDSIKDVKQVNRFKVFIDEIYKIFYQSNKNQIALMAISDGLGTEIQKIGRIFDPCWAACSHRSAVATWQAYPLLYDFFSTDKKFAEMARCLSNKSFISDLALMIDILEEISLLSYGLQGRCVNISRAEQLINRTIKAFEFFKEHRGTYEKRVNETISSKEFQRIQFVEDNSYVGLPRQELLNAVIINVRLRLMDCDGSNIHDTNYKILELVKIMSPELWNVEEAVVPWKDAEEKLPDFSKIFRHEVPVNDFRDYLENVTRNYHNHIVPETIQRAKNIINTIAVSSAEAEKVFSVMNTIYSDKRNCFEVKNVANLLVINLIGLPLDLWDCSDSVRMWLRNYNETDDIKVKKEHSSEQEYDENRISIWKYLG